MLSIFTKLKVKRERLQTLAPNSTRLARFWTDLATNVSVLAAVGDGGSVKRRGSKKKKKCITHCIISDVKLKTVFFNRCSPAMMLNILGLRIAGQISLRKTKPLEKNNKKAVYSHSKWDKSCRLQKYLIWLLNLLMSCPTWFAGLHLPHNPCPHGVVARELLLNRLLQAAIDEP